MGEAVIGLFRLKQRLANMSAVVRFQGARALYEEAQIEMAESQRRVPVETGALRDSGKVDLAIVLDKEISVKLHYGSTLPSSDYATIQHEDLELNHPNGGQAKFLESVILESAPYMGARVARRIDLSRE